MHPLYSKPPLHLNDNVRSYFGCPQSIINQAACSYSCSCTCNRNASHIVVLKLYLCKINFTPVHGNVIALIGQNYLLMFREIKARELSMINIVAVGTPVIKPGYFIFKKSSFRIARNLSALQDTKSTFENIDFFQEPTVPCLLKMFFVVVHHT